jgi:hypothetical protein
MKRWGILLALVASLAFVPAANAQVAGGPVVLMGIDAEDGGLGGHGPVAVYQSVMRSIARRERRSGSAILVLGGGKTSTDNVSTFFRELARGARRRVRLLNGAARIRRIDFNRYGIVAIASSASETSSGGLTQDENNALAARRRDLARFVNAGGGLFGLSQSGFSNPYAYLARLGSFRSNVNLNYSDITPTRQGRGVGITNALDVTAWHDEFTRYPRFLTVLARNPATGRPAALGGTSVFIGRRPPARRPRPRQPSFTG